MSSTYVRGEKWFVRHDRSSFTLPPRFSSLDKETLRVLRQPKGRGAAKRNSSFAPFGRADATCRA